MDILFLLTLLLCIFYSGYGKNVRYESQDKVTALPSL